MCSPFSTFLFVYFSLIFSCCWLVVVVVMVVPLLFYMYVLLSCASSLLLCGAFHIHLPCAFDIVVAFAEDSHMAFSGWMNMALYRYAYIRSDTTDRQFSCLSSVQHERPWTLGARITILIESLSARHSIRVRILACNGILHLLRLVKLLPCNIFRQFFLFFFCCCLFCRSITLALQLFAQVYPVCRGKKNPVFFIASASWYPNLLKDLFVDTNSCLNRWLYFWHFFLPHCHYQR